MSYDIDFHPPACPTCNHATEIEGITPTYNLGNMFRASLDAAGLVGSGLGGAPTTGIQALHGMTGREATPYLEAARAWMVDAANLEAIESMTPSNGWGTPSDARWVFATILGWCQRFPDGVIDTRCGAGLNLPDADQ